MVRINKNNVYSFSYCSDFLAGITIFEFFVLRLLGLQYNSTGSLVAVRNRSDN